MRTLLTPSLSLPVRPQRDPPPYLPFLPPQTLHSAQMILLCHLLTLRPMRYLRRKSKDSPRNRNTLPLSRFIKEEVTFATLRYLWFLHLPQPKTQLDRIKDPLLHRHPRIPLSWYHSNLLRRIRQQGRVSRRLDLIRPPCRL